MLTYPFFLSLAYHSSVLSARLFIRAFALLFVHCVHFFVYLWFMSLLCPIRSFRSTEHISVYSSVWLFIIAFFFWILDHSSLSMSYSSVNLAEYWFLFVRQPLSPFVHLSIKHLCPISYSSSSPYLFVYLLPCSSVIYVSHPSGDSFIYLAASLSVVLYVRLPYTIYVLSSASQSASRNPFMSLSIHRFINSFEKSYGWLGDGEGWRVPCGRSNMVLRWA